MPSESSDSVKIHYPKFSKDELIALLKEGSVRLSKELPAVRVILFGSYAKNRHTAASDVDLLVIYRDPKKENDYDIVWSAFNIDKLEPHVYTVSDYEKLARRNNWLEKEVRRSGVSIFDDQLHDN
jgi:uncharacterized protein